MAFSAAGVGWGGVGWVGGREAEGLCTRMPACCKQQPGKQPERTNLGEVGCRGAEGAKLAGVHSMALAPAAEWTRQPPHACRPSSATRMPSARHPAPDPRWLVQPCSATPSTFQSRETLRLTFQVGKGSVCSGSHARQQEQLQPGHAERHRCCLAPPPHADRNDLPRRALSMQLKCWAVRLLRVPHCRRRQCPRRRHCRRKSGAHSRRRASLCLGPAVGVPNGALEA